MLTTTQLAHLLRNHGTHFLGVCPLNGLPRKLKSRRKVCFIVNTDRDNLPGKHWLAVHVDSRKRGEVFDSFGRLPPAHLQNWLNKNCSSWTYNKTLVQGVLTTLCGGYCVYVLDNRCSTGRPMSVIIQQEFNPFNVLQNDRKVKRYMLKTFNILV